jgi:hypothetical protein
LSEEFPVASSQLPVIRPQYLVVSRQKGVL